MAAPSDIGGLVIGQSPLGIVAPDPGTINPVLPRIIPSYLFQEYSDDDDLQALVFAFNEYAQSYLDYLNDLQLPIYTRVQVSGLLLDWVAEGLYGITRPVLPSGLVRSFGPYNTARYNVLRYNGYKHVGPSTYYATSDDVFRRIITWSFYKSDGFQISTRWLKRRIQRFLQGDNGTDPPVDQTYQISVAFTGTSVNIRILSGVRTVIGGAIYNRNRYNSSPYNQLKTKYQQLTPIPMAPIFKAAIDAGVLPLPFQYTYNVSV